LALLELSALLKRMLDEDHALKRPLDAALATVRLWARLKPVGSIKLYRRSNLLDLRPGELHEFARLERFPPSR
jgi:hypothetical protein